MGTWGIQNFENDNALDLVNDIIEGDKNIIKSKIKKLLTPPMLTTSKHLTVTKHLRQSNLLRLQKETLLKNSPKMLLIG